jgi:hypothetical protein
LTLARTKALKSSNISHSSNLYLYTLDTSNLNQQKSA